MHVRFNLKNFLSWLTYSVDVRIYPSLRVITFKLSVAFMALLVFISSVIVGIGIAYTVKNRIIEIAHIYDQHFPDGRLTDGMLILEDDTPVTYKGRGYQVVMDVTGNTHERESEFPIALFFMRDKVVIDTAQTESKEYSYSYFGRTDLVITAGTIHAARFMFAVIAFLFWCALLFLDWSMRAALMTMLGSFIVGIVAASFRILLPRNEQLKIALTAAAPVIVLTAIEHLLLLNEGIGMGIVPLPNSLYIMNITVFVLFLIFGSRGYLLPFLPKNPE